jgi:hypothetical protein
MVGRSSEISRETCRKKVVDSRRQNGEWGPLQDEWSRPDWRHVVANQRERINDIGQLDEASDRSQSSHSSDETVQQNAVERRGIGR